MCCLFGKHHSDSLACELPALTGFARCHVRVILAGQSDFCRLPITPTVLTDVRVALQNGGYKSSKTHNVGTQSEFLSINSLMADEQISQSGLCLAKLSSLMRNVLTLLHSRF